MVTVDPEGQVAILEDLREQLGLGIGAEIELCAEGKQLIVESKQDPEEFWQELLSVIEREYERDR